MTEKKKPSLALAAIPFALGGVAMFVAGWMSDNAVFYGVGASFFGVGAMFFAISRAQASK